MHISFTEENYLKAIYHSQEKANGLVSTNTLSDALQTKAASVTDMLKKLAEKNLINYEKYQGVSLTADGKQKALTIIRKHRLWEVFMVDKLAFKWDEVHELAEELEHIHSEKLINKLDEFLGFPKYDPHGDPIPDSDGNIKSEEFIVLAKLNIGDGGKISGIKAHSKEFLQYLEKMHLTIGQKITVQDKISFDGSIILKINNQEKSISREVAQNLLIG
jgi:DtxR family Mn-dependent transcriptional regulator